LSSHIAAPTSPLRNKRVELTLIICDDRHIQQEIDLIAGALEGAKDLSRPPRASILFYPNPIAVLGLCGRDFRAGFLPIVAICAARGSCS
jgi:hypothetical protein